MTEENKVGYKNPPIETRFKSGQSGNPKGRPRGSLNISTIVEREGSTKVNIKEGNKQIKLSKREVIIKSLFNKAMSGDKNALKLCIELMKELDFNNEMKGLNTEEISKADKEIFDNFKKTILPQEEIKKEIVNV